MENLVSSHGLTRTRPSQAAPLSLMTRAKPGAPPRQSMEIMLQDRENGDTVVMDVLLQVKIQLPGLLHHGHLGLFAVDHVEEDQSKDQEVMEEFKLLIVIRFHALPLVLLKKWRFKIQFCKSQM